MNTSSKFVVSVHILTLLAGRKFIFGDEEGLNSEDIANSVGTNPVVIRRLLSVFRQNKIVASKSGPNGGSYLCADAKTIKLSEIYNIVEDGNLYHLHYSPPNKICPVGSHIQEDLTQILQKAEDAFKMVLEEKTLHDMLTGIVEKVEGFKNKTKLELAEEWNNTLKEMNRECALKM